MDERETPQSAAPRRETALEALHRARAAQEAHDRRLDVQLTLKLGKALGLGRV